MSYLIGVILTVLNLFSNTVLFLTTLVIANNKFDVTEENNHLSIVLIGLFYTVVCTIFSKIIFLNFF